MSSLALSAPSARDVLVGAVAAGLTAHQIFKRYEPEGIPAHAALLVLPPALFASLLASYYTWPFAILAAGGTYLATLVLSVLAYRLSPFHPLARYPGPVALKLSKLTMSRIASTGQQHKYIKALHEKYGDAVRTGPNEVSIRHPDAIAAISTLPKGPRWINGKMAFSKEHSLIAEPDTHKHTVKRKPWNRAFNTAALKGYEETIAKRITELANVLATQKGPADLGKWLGHWS
ncbi:hypothetical protein BD413DRAFT_487319 [Trametes elegans]|nr:hypothetical protein BD413DRAFT_487319 [Trametes elegans]